MKTTDSETITDSGTGAESGEAFALPDDEARFLSNLGLAARARALVFGTPQVLDAIRSGNKPAFVFAAADASDATRKQLRDKCAFYHVRLVELSLPGGRIAAAVGKQSALAAVAVLPLPIAALVGKHFTF